MEGYKTTTRNKSSEGDMSTGDYGKLLLNEHPAIYRQLQHLLRYETMIWEKGKEVLQRRKVEFGV